MNFIKSLSKSFTITKQLINPVKYLYTPREAKPRSHLSG